ncbi:hypothetical protein OG21DRAFT_1487915 [Imleria badia]|nr:hypothetical protein OG21DRAFT_1487915 [Imleria badia]
MTSWQQTLASLGASQVVHNNTSENTFIVATPVPGYHRIRTSNGAYLTLLAQNDTLTAQPDSPDTNQIWDFQRVGNNWTIRNTGYAATIYAFSGGLVAAPVSGNAAATLWALFPNNGVFSIQLGDNFGNAWEVGANGQVTLGATDLQEAAQEFAIE